MTEFTPLTSFVGGCLIGISAVGVLLVSGRVAGISGLVRRALVPAKDSRSLDAAAFIAGLLLASFVCSIATGGSVQHSVSDNLVLYSIAGLLVGSGAMLGNGCTSGHGVCGLSRFSKRSAVATATFMSVAVLTVFVSRHVLGG